MALPTNQDVIQIEIGQQLSWLAIPDPILAFLESAVLVTKEFPVDVFHGVSVPMSTALDRIDQLRARHADVDGQIDLGAVWVLKIPQLRD